MIWSAEIDGEVECFEAHSIADIVRELTARMGGDPSTVRLDSVEVNGDKADVKASVMACPQLDRLTMDVRVL